MQYAWVMANASGGLILPMHLPPFVFSQPIPIQNGNLNFGGHGMHPAHALEAPRMVTLEEIEKNQILRVLDKHQGNKPAVAAELGISLKTLYNKLNRYAELGLAAAG